ncbi:hypothetical protein [Jiella avicenniae]|uniref:hypothetical protein n=1 Tax=Jiella avicenniae TaxID=2907202 RepID=UPI001F200425|nr:hypothetical protein [Jiella avicenniae]
MKEIVPFVEALAWLYLRKPHHAVRIINNFAPGDAALFGNSVQNAISLLRYDVSDLESNLASSDPNIRTKAEKTRNNRLYQRDGLLFQHISWLAARLQFPTALATPPHVRKADKGFDGFLIERQDAGDAISRIILCEDKATTNPRNLVTTSIWPEIRSIVASERDLEILDALTALLSGVPEEEREGLIRDIVWQRTRCFRVALTTGPGDIKASAYAHLFEGFDEQVTGDATVRRGDVMPLADVRGYLDQLAASVISVLERM